MDAATDGFENYPAYKAEFVKKCLETDGVVTEIDPHRFGHKYHAGFEDDDGWVWMATIETDNGDGLDGDERTPSVTFRKCLPGNEVRVLHSWSTVAVKRLTGPSDLESWRSIHQVFHAADTLLQSHPAAVDTEPPAGGDAV